MIHSLHFRLLRSLALVLLLDCQRSGKPPFVVLAQVNEVTIAQEDFETFFALQTKGKVPVQGAPLALKQTVLRKLVVLELVVREAHRVGFEKRHPYPADKDGSVYVKKEWLANGLLQEMTFPPIPEATEKERRSYYDAHHQEFTIPERIRASVVIVADEATAARLRGDKRMLQDAGSKDYLALVNESCTDALIRSHGGELGWVLKSNNHGWQPQNLIEAAGRLKNIRDISQPIKTDQGWAIFKLTDHHAEELSAYDMVRDDVGHSVKMVKFSQQTEDFIAQLRAKATVSVHEDRLRE